MRVRATISLDQLQPKALTASPALQLNARLEMLPPMLPLVSHLLARAKYNDQFRATPAPTAAKSYWDRIAQFSVSMSVSTAANHMHTLSSGGHRWCMVVP
eukprot:1161174-Pelagomonas_calceolata.AAC.3